MSEPPAMLGTDGEINVLSADLNGDGVDDLVVLEEASLGAAILFDSEGAITARNTVPVGLRSFPNRSNELLDLDRDGDLDLLLSDGSLDYVRYALNDGTGAFGVHAILPIQLRSFAVATFAGDGAPDLVGSIDSSLIYFRNDGPLTFTPIATTPVTGLLVAVGDVSDDEGIDVLTTSSLFVSTLVPGTGTNYPLPAIGKSLVDLDGDGRSEIIGTTSTDARNSRPTEIVVMAFDGTAVQVRQRLTLPVTTPPGIAAGDFDQDGDVDIAVTPVSRRVSGLRLPGPLPCEVLLLMNQGDGTLSVAHSLYSGGIGAGGVAVGRFRADAPPSLCVAHHGYEFTTPPSNAIVGRGRVVSLLEHMLESPSQHLLQNNAFRNCSSTLCVDLNQDMAPDLVTIVGNTVQARIATSPGVFSDLAVGNPPNLLFRLFMADLDTDGIAEAPVATSANGLAWRIGLESVSTQPTPGYVPGVALRLNALPSSTRLSVPGVSSVSDMDHDSDLDYVTYRLGSIASNRSFIRVELYDQGIATMVETEVPGRIVELVAVDANLDGADDVAVYKSLDPLDPACNCNHQWSLELYLNNGAGALAPPQSLLMIPNQVTGMVSEDFCGTAARDLVVTVSNGDIHLFASAPTGLQGPFTTSIAPLALARPAVADFDLDGEPDLVSPAWPAGFKLESAEVTEHVMFVRGNGMGSLQRSSFAINVQNFADRALACDYDADGDSDLLIEHLGCGLSLFPNLSTPTDCPADANGDLLIDGRDLSLLLSTFGDTSVKGRGADLNSDGTIDGADLAVLLSQFGAPCL